MLMCGGGGGGLAGGTYLMLRMQNASGSGVSWLHMSVLHLTSKLNSNTAPFASLWWWLTHFFFVFFCHPSGSRRT